MESNPFDQFDTQANPFDQFDAKPRTLRQDIGRIGTMGGRMAMDAVAALPLAAMDAGVGLRNLVTGSNYESPSSMYSSSMDQLLGVRTPLETGVGLIGSGLIGSRLPVPTVKQPAPAGFSPPLTQSQQVLADSQKAGYVVPPTTSNPTATNKVLEGIAGKLTTAQAASAKNQSVTTGLAKRSLGLPEDAPLTAEAIQGVRRQAGDAYRVIRGAGQITADQQFADDVAALGSKYRGASKDFPDLAKSEVDDLVRGLSQNADGTPKAGFDADSAVDLISILRERADKAFRAGDSGLGKAYKDATKALENVIERSLKSRGSEGAGMLKEYRTAREAIAKSYTVEKAFNPATGQVSGTKLAAQLSKGKPLSGDLLAAGRFGQAFPKAAREFNESLPGISPLDFYATGGTAAVTQQPWYLLYPFLRQGVRNGLLSPLGQRLALPSGGPVDPKVAAALATEAGLLGQQ